jgi:APA family basic amino acid/polyamine antiporter
MAEFSIGRRFRKFSAAPIDLLFNLPAFLITWVVTAILVKGIKEAAKTNNFIVIVKIAVVLFVIIVGAFYIKTENWTPFIPTDEMPALDELGNANW